MEIYKSKQKNINTPIGSTLESIENINDVIKDIKVGIAHILYSKYKSEYYIPDYNNPDTYIDGSYETVMLSINKSICDYKHYNEENIIEYALNDWYGEESYLLVINNDYILLFKDSPCLFDLEDYKQQFINYLTNQINVTEIKNDILNLSDEELAKKYISSTDHNLFIF